jgi:aryl-alcohol dehydrogenase-like predicted oxidoreductase
VIVKEALANGRLTTRNAGAEIRREGHRRRPRRGTRSSSLAAALANPWADVALSGAATEGQLRSNVAAIDVVMTQDIRDRIASFAEAPKEYWQRRASLPWA